MIHKLIIINILLTIILFYTGVHLCEQETAVLDGLRTLDRDAYDWASLFFAKMTFVFALYACFVALKIAVKKTVTGVFLGVLGVGIAIYSLMKIINIERITMQLILPIIGVYIIGTICLNVFALFYIPIQKLQKV